MERPLLLLFDGHALVHRAYHAFASTPLTISKTGEEVSAVYGFALMLLKVLQEFKPTHWAIAFDLPTPTFRHQKFAEYKANRPPVPDELRKQIQRVKEMVKAFNIPIFEIEGYEADDVLGTLSRKANSSGIEVVIITGDADTMQLVSPMTKVLYPKPGRPFSDTELFDEIKVLQRYGLFPKQLPDFKGLKGDPSDNIPGVPGIGEKTALKLLQQFGSLEGIYEHLEEVNPPQLRQILLQNKEIAFRSRELATILTEIPITFDLQACAITSFDRQQVLKLFRELEFYSLIPKLPQPTVQFKESPQGIYRVINTEEAWEELKSKLSSASSLVIDVEATGKEEMGAELVGIALCLKPGEAYYIPLGHRTWERQLPLKKVIEDLLPFLENPSLPKIAHNGKYDMTVLYQYGVEIKPLSFDTMIAAHLLGEKSLSLKSLAFSQLGIEMTPITSLIGTGAKQISIAQVPISQVAEYACADADITFQLKEVLESALKREGLWQPFTEVEMPLVPILFEMERNGVALDVNLLKELSLTLGEEIGKLEDEIYALVGYRFNINSPQQLQKILYEVLKLPHLKRTKTGYSTEAAVLEELKGLHPIIELLLNYRQLMKLKSTYVDALPLLINPKTGRIHTTFHQTGTATGRISSSDPNLQNIPVRGEWGRRIRQAFIAPEGFMLLSGDYSQIDLRVLAHLSQDPILISSFLKDEDIHSSTASQIFGVKIEEITPEMRRIAKTVNFGVIYGMSEYGLEEATELNREEARRFIQTYFERYKGVKAYLEATKQKARERGYVETLLGKRRYIPEINSSNKQVREAGERMAINMPIQGTSADIIKLAMLNIHKEIKKRGLRAKMLLQVHDELLFEVPEEEVEETKKMIKEIMPHSLKLSVPLKVEVKTGKNWGDME